VYLYEDIETFRARTPAERVRSVRAHSAAAVILTRGAQGLVAGGDPAVELPALHARCIDVTGAGDALVAGTLYGLCRNADLPEAARLGLAAAAITVECEGATDPRLCPEALDARA
jgi:pseudouridine kinase